MKQLIVFFIVTIFSSTIFSCKDEAVSTLINTGIIQDTSYLQLLETYNLNITEPSGLAYDMKDNTLFTVSDNYPFVYKISLTGLVLDSIYTAGTDLEGVCFSDSLNRFFLIEERYRRLDEYSISGMFIDSFRVNITGPENNGLEGIARDNITGNIFVANQKNPCELIELTDKGLEIKRTQISYVPEINDLFFDDSLKCLWMLSSTAKSVYLITTDGKFLKGWNITAVKAEGITVYDDKIYIVSDSEHKLFIYKRP